jgi:predicted alpha/beta hydrolase
LFGYMRACGLRAVALALAERGQHVFRFDYRGTGDSSGELGEVTVSDWLQDVALTVKKGREISGSSRVRLLGVRAARCLACAAAHVALPEVQRQSWGSVPDGAAYLESMRRVR